MGAGAVSAPELNDVQGLVARGYGDLTSARFLLVGIDDAAAGAALARRVAGALTASDAARRRGGQHRVHELRASRSSASPEATRRPLRERVRRRDDRPRTARGRSATSPRTRPSTGTGAARGRPGRRRCSSSTPGTSRLSPTLEREQAPASRPGCRSLREARHVEPRRPRAVRLPRRHLAAVPRGSLEAGPARDDVALGEFVLGYPNEYGRYTDQPLLDAARARAQRHVPRLPPAAPGRSRLLELRRPGDAARRRERRPRARLRLAAKMVGRWPSGAPLALAPDGDDPALARGERLRLLRARPHGARCPVGSHIRRANPRDSLDPKPGTQSRGRSTGATGSCAAAASTGTRSS